MNFWFVHMKIMRQKKKKKNLSQFVIRIVLLTLDKGVVSSYDCKSDIFMLSNAILLINSNKFSVKMLKRREKNSKSSF